MPASTKPTPRPYQPPSILVIGPVVVHTQQSNACPTADVQWTTCTSFGPPPPSAPEGS